MKLLYQTHSPYARKVLVFAHEAGLADGLEVIHHETSPTQRNETIFGLNPLGKVPVLVLEDGLALFDSAVICDYLDGLHYNHRLIPVDGRVRLLSYRLQALAHGLCDAGIAVRHETERRPAPYRYAEMRDGQIAKLVASYDFIEREELLGCRGRPCIGQIALATALSWLAFRDLSAFKPGRPRLEAWYRTFIARPSMQATPFSGNTVD